MPKVYSNGRVYTKRTGMDGPYQYPNGRVLYFDPKEKQFYDPSTDFYVYKEEIEGLQNSVFALLAK